MAKFNSTTGAEAGSRGRRGASKITTEVKERLDEFTEDVFKAIQYGIKRKDIAFIKLWLQYRVGNPKQITELHTDINDFKPIEIHFTHADDGD